MATKSKRVLGFENFGSYRDSQDVGILGEIRAIYLLEEYWRKGIGSHLLEFADSSLSECYDKAALWVLKSNIRAIEFYKRHGFTIDGVEKSEPLADIMLNEIRLSKAINRLRIASPTTTGQ